MAERSSVFQLIQIGVETTPGTQVAATKRISSTQFTLGVKPTTKYYRGSGHLFDTVGTLNQEMVQGSYAGALTYTEIIYYLSSVIGAITPPTQNMDTATPTGSYTWVFSPNLTSANTPATFTIEQGESASRYHNALYSLLTSFKLDISRDGCDISGDVTAQALIDEGDGAVFTGLISSDEVALIPVLPTQVSIYTAAAQADLDAADPLTRVDKVAFELTGRWAPLFVLNGSPTFISHLAQVPTLDMKVTMEADAAGMAYLANLRSQDSVFVRVQAVGASIYSGGTDYNYTFQIDLAGKIGDVSDFGDTNGLTTVEWTFHGVEDTTWGKAVEFTVINEVAAL